MRYAKEFNKPIFCIPHIIGDKAGDGINKLLKDGAKLATSVDDILPYFKHIEKTQVVRKKVEVKVPAEYQEVYNSLNKERNADELSRMLKTNIVNINTALTMLELEGFIEKMPGNFFKQREI